MTPDEAVALLRESTGYLWVTHAEAIADLIESTDYGVLEAAATYVAYLESIGADDGPDTPSGRLIKAVRAGRRKTLIPPSPEQKFREELEELRDVYSGEHTCVRIDTAVRAARKAGLLRDE